MKILIINGPNLNFLGKRDKQVYGPLSLNSINKIIKKEFLHDELTFVQTNLEGEIINQIHAAPKKFDAIVINPGGYSHTSVAIRDALADCKIPKIEVHLSNLSGREDFRQKMITAASCDGYIAGFKDSSYIGAIYLLHKIIHNTKRKN